MAIVGPIFLVQKSSLHDIKVPIFLPRLILGPVHLGLVSWGCSEQTQTRVLGFAFFIGPIAEASLTYHARIVHGVESSMYNKACGLPAGCPLPPSPARSLTDRGCHRRCGSTHSSSTSSATTPGLSWPPLSA